VPQETSVESVAVVTHLWTVSTPMQRRSGFKSRQQTDRHRHYRRHHRRRRLCRLYRRCLNTSPVALPSSWAPCRCPDSPNTSGRG
jgi:hypothetical protein